MSNIINSLYNLRLLDDLAAGETFIHRIHPLIKLLVTVFYIIGVVSCGRYEVSGLLPFVFYPVLLMALADLPAAPILKRTLVVLPLVVGLGILNPVFDSRTVTVLGLTVSRGWVTFLSILIKSCLTVTAGILLIATTGMDRLASALRSLGIPKIFVLQLLLTYRYLTVLLEELSLMMRAYSLRAPGQRGIRPAAWGSFAGQLLLRTYDRGQRVYQAMNLRGFQGEYYTGRQAKAGLQDWVYLAGWSLFFFASRMYNIPSIIGSLFTGVF